MTSTVRVRASPGPVYGVESPMCTRASSALHALGERCIAPSQGWPPGLYSVRTQGRGRPVWLSSVVGRCGGRRGWGVGKENGMEIKQQLRLSQQLVMTPQLQQAIKLLQMSRMELVDMVREELMENPVLEDSMD